MLVLADKAGCSGCHACYNSCPEHCITMKKDDEGFLYPHINQDICCDCGLCEKVCPFKDIKKKDEPLEAWAANCKSKEIRINSSSGGVFSILALEVLENGGVVFGASFSSDFRKVIHTSIEDKEALEKLRTSKYVQSEIGDSYQSVKKLLDRGVEVLFSGVPCQISGLKKFLGKSYENLLCVDVICHGVPSPDLWSKYLDWIENSYHGKVSDVNFRHKKNGWQNFGISETVSGVDYFSKKEKDPYMQMFLSNLSLRLSCYSCQIKANGSDADITLGDFWGIDNIYPEMNDGDGTSAVIVHTLKGRRLFQKIEKDIVCRPVSFEVIKKYNTPIYKSVNKPNMRSDFFSDVTQLRFEDLTEKYCPHKRIRLKQILSETKLWKKLRFVIRGGGYRE